MIFSFFFLSFQKSIGDLLVQMVTIYKASTHRSTILIDRNLMPTLMSTFTRLLDIQLDLFISYKSQNVFENKSYYFIVYQPSLIFQNLPTLFIRIPNPFQYENGPCVCNYRIPRDKKYSNILIIT